MKHVLWCDIGIDVEEVISEFSHSWKKLFRLKKINEIVFCTKVLVYENGTENYDKPQ